THRGAALRSAQVEQLWSPGESQSLDSLARPLPGDVGTGNVEYRSIERGVVGRLIDRDRKSELLDHRKRPCEEVVVAVIEREDDGPWRQIILAEPGYGFAERQH